MCKTEISLAHYEDETVIRYMLFVSERLLYSQLLERMRKLLKDSEKQVFYNKYRRKTQVFRYLSCIFALKPGFHLGISLVAGEIFVSETQKKIIVPQIFSSDL